MVIKVSILSQALLSNKGYEVHMDGIQVHSALNLMIG